MYCFNCMQEAEARGVCPHCHKQNVPDRIPHHLPPGTILNGKYVVGNSLGEGGFGITYVGLDKQLQMRVAIKEYYPLGNANRNNSQSNNVYTSTQSQTDQYDKGKERFMREAQSVAQFSGAQGVVNIKNYFEENNTAYIIMEYLEGENLLQHINRHGNFAADKLFRLMLPMMKSLREIHNKGVIHRDISPDNIIIHNDTLTLTDFGSARYYSNRSNEMSVMLKQGYAPEEQYRSTGNQGTWTDVYGLCATIYKCITGVTPQNGLDRAHVDQLKSPSELGADISKPLEAVLMYGMAVYHNDRCRDMNELMEMTQNALNNLDPNVPLVHAAIDTDRTVSANDIDWNAQKQVGNVDNRRIPPTDLRQQQQQLQQEQQGQRREPEQQSKAPVIAAVSIAAVAVVLAIVVLILMLNKNGDSNTDSTTAAESTAVATHDASVSAVIPDLVGKTYKEATALLDKQELDYETIMESTNDIEKDNKVLVQDPKAGETGNKVTITVGSYKEPETEPQTEEPETEPQTEEPEPFYTNPPIITARSKTLYCSLCNDYVTLRPQPSPEGVITRVPKYASVKLIEELDDSEYIKVQFNDQTGYVMEAYFTSEKYPTTQKVMFCRARDYANIRSRAGSNNENNIKTVPSGATVKYLGYSSTVGNQEYLYVKYKGVTGYMLAAVLNEDPNSALYTGT